MGVDFKSGGTTGKKIYAVGDGYVMRVTTSPFGYGKALYLRLDTGEIAVYGHLSKFLPGIEDRLFHLRINAGSYDIDWWPRPGEIRVEKGQVVAFSGDTGGGPAHLHLELRDEDNNPLNFMQSGLEYRDVVPPTIQSIVLIPLDRESTVDGFSTARWYDPSANDTEPIHLSGRIGVAVSAWDRINGARNLMGIYGLSLAVDDSVVFSKRYDRLSYALNGCGGLDYLFGELYGGSGLISALFRRPGNLIDFYEGDGVLCSTAYGMTDSATLTVRAQDNRDNTITASVPVVFGERPVFHSCGYDGKGMFRIEGGHGSAQISHAELWKHEDSGRILSARYMFEDDAAAVTDDMPAAPAWYTCYLVAEDSTRSLPITLRLDAAKPPTPASADDSAADSAGRLSITTMLRHDRVVIRVASEHGLSSMPVIRVFLNGSDRPYEVLHSVPESDTSWVASLPITDSGVHFLTIEAFAFDRSLKRIEGEASCSFTMLTTSSRATVPSPDNRLVMHVPSGALYRPAPVKVARVPVTATNGLVLVSEGYQITFGDAPLRNSFQVNLRLDAAPAEKAAIYRMNRENGNKNTWRFVESERKGSVVSGPRYGSCVLAVFEDITLPTIRPLSPKPSSTISSRKPLLMAEVWDKGSGIGGSNSFAMSIDGIPVYGEYDFEADTIKYTLHNDLSPGKHVVQLKVTDRVENNRSREWSFTVAE